MTKQEEASPWFYWNQVLKEVKQKSKQKQDPYYLTSLGEHLMLAEPTPAMARQPRKGSHQYYCERVWLGKEYPGIYLTRREAQCVVQVLYGKTMKGIARDLQLSIRTVEYYVRNAKGKVNCRSRSALIRCLLRSEFCDNYKAKNFDLEQ